MTPSFRALRIANNLIGPDSSRVYWYGEGAGWITADELAEIIDREMEAASESWDVRSALGE